MIEINVILGTSRINLVVEAAIAATTAAHIVEETIIDLTTNVHRTETHIEVMATVGDHQIAIEERIRIDREDNIAVYTRVKGGSAYFYFCVIESSLPTARNEYFPSTDCAR